MLKPGARACFAAWGPMEQPYWQTTMKIVHRHVGGAMLPAGRSRSFSILGRGLSFRGAQSRGISRGRGVDSESCPGPGRETRKKFSNTACARGSSVPADAGTGAGGRRGRRSARRRRRRSSAIAWEMRSGSAPTWFWRREKRECAGPVKIKVAWIGKTKEPAIQALTDEYLKRISRYAEVAGRGIER